MNGPARCPVVRRATVALVLALACALAPAAAPAARLTYPETPVRAVADTLHGTVLLDPYRWLEDGDSPEVQKWTAAENTLTRTVLDAFPERRALLSRLRMLYGATVTTGPSVYGSRLFYSRRSGGQNQPVVLVRDVALREGPEVAIDPNGLSADGTVALDWMHPSPDGARVAYGTSAGGNEKSTLRVRDLATGRDLPDAIPYTQWGSVAWDPNGGGFLYSRHPAPGDVPQGDEVFYERICYHRLDSDPAADPVVFSGEGRAKEETRSVYNSSDSRWVFLSTSLDWARNDLYVRPAGSTALFTPVAVGLDGTTAGDASGGRLYLLTNVGAPRYRIVAADPAAGGPDRWQVVVPEQSGVIESFQILGDDLAVLLLENATSRVVLFGLDGRPRREIPLPALGTVSGLSAAPEGHELFFTFTSFAHPPAVHRYDLARGRLQRVEKTDPGFRASRYETRQAWVTSKDGTRLPMFLVHRRGLTMDGNRPTLLEGYGGFNVSSTPSFRAMVLPWLDRGGVYAEACLRGGGEFGRAWHEAGRRERKQNVFDDFHAAAEWLIREEVTRPERLAAEGGSNGGLLVGAALTQRPDLFGAVVCRVPLLDMIRYQRFSIARYWVPEYGASDDSTQFRYLLAYSPYQNVKDGVRYPATLLTTSEFDARVDPLHARKMTALLQAKSAGDAPILLRTESRAGHGAGKPTSKRIEEAADILGFLMMRFGI